MVFHLIHEVIASLKALVLNFFLSVLRNKTFRRLVTGILCSTIVIATIYLFPDAAGRVLPHVIVQYYQELVDGRMLAAYQLIEVGLFTTPTRAFTNRFQSYDRYHILVFLRYASYFVHTFYDLADHMSHHLWIMSVLMTRYLFPG